MKGIDCCTRTHGVGGSGGLGVLSKGYPDGKFGGVDLDLKIKKEPPLLCNQSRCGDAVAGGVINGADADARRPTFEGMGSPCLSNTCHFAAGDSTTVSVPVPPPPVAVPVALSTVPDDDGVIGASAGSARSSLQAYPTYCPFLKSPGGGGMATTMGFFPFTAAQWKELQRQAMIYKYMLACIPVPNDLLFPIDPSGSASYWEKMGMFNVRWTGDGKAAEPGRCKRTDGKKWRCSKDVVPNQKYCERHLNRGRPRSRKPVEMQADFSIDATRKTRLGEAQNSSLNLLNLKTGANGSSSGTHRVGPGCPVLGFDGNQESSGSPFFAPMVPVPSVDEEARNLKWQVGMKNVGLATDGSFYSTNSSVFQHYLGNESSNSSCYLNINSNKANLLQSCCLGSSSIPAKGFIDVWCNGLPKNNDGLGASVISNSKIAPSSLALSICGSNLIDEEMCSIRVGDGVINSSSYHIGEGSKDNMSSWIGPSTWFPSNSYPGGPLAEVLQPRPVSATDTTLDSVFPTTRNADLVTPPSTTVSSPSGVLQKNLASFSDSSGCNSPTSEERKAKS